MLNPFIFMSAFTQFNPQWARVVGYGPFYV
jgi:hypothetical protein